MSNDIIQKNAELGRFIFCERYTLQPVKNSLYIAEGQDLKRGAVVDVNGVLVGTNSLMPYAVLENDCDTRAKGAFASVFVKGEFNIDKLFFADGLSKNDLDNIVYNGSGIGLVIKPYTYDEGFSSAMVPAGTSASNPLMNAIEIEELIYANKEISPKTIRFSFDNLDFDPNTFFAVAERPPRGTFTKIQGHYANIWDYTLPENETSLNNEFGLTTIYGHGLFGSRTSYGKVINSDIVGITDLRNAFYACTGLTEIWKMNTSTVKYFYRAFSNCRKLVVFPDVLDLRSASIDNYGLAQMMSNDYLLPKAPKLDFKDNAETAFVLTNTFYRCYSMKSIELDCTHITSMHSAFIECYSLNDVKITHSEHVTVWKQCFQYCSSLSECPVTDLSGATDIESMYAGIRYTSNTNYTLVTPMHIKEIPQFTFKSSGNVIVANMFGGNYDITHIPTLDWPTISDCSITFCDCPNVETGLLDAYLAMKSKIASSSTSTHDCFKGDDKSQDINYIPKSWGGKAEG